MPPIRSKSQSRLSQVIEVIILCMVIALLWQAMVSLGLLNSTFVASPIKIASAMWEFRDTLMDDSLFSLKWMILGYITTVSAAFVVALIMHLITPRLSRPAHWLIVMLQCVPVFAIGPALVYVLGIDWRTRLVTIALVAFFPVLVTTVEGLRQIDPELLELFDSMKATKLQKLIRLEIPSAIQMVAAGSKITLTMCAIGVVVAEMLVGERVGLGYRIKEAGTYFRADKVFACIVLLAAIVAALYAILSLSARRVEHWRE